MSVASLFNFDIDDPASVARFAFANSGEHFKIQTAVFQKFNVNLSVFPLDPIPLNDFQGWARAHQSMHSAANAVLGLPGNDLTSVDLTKPEDIAVWKYEHASEHQRFQLALGLN